MANSILDRSRLVRLRRSCKRYRTGKAAGEFLARLVRLSTPVLVGVATVVFLAKLLWPGLALAVAVVPVWLLGVCAYLALTRRGWRTPGWRANAVTDYHTGNRGLYMALEEAEGGDWAGRLAEGAEPVRGPLPARSMAVMAALFAAVVAVSLLPDLRPPSKKRGSAATPVNKAAELVGALDANELADPEYLEKASELLDKLKRKEEETGRMSADDWQALDECRDELRRQTAESFQKLEAERLLAQKLAQKLERREPLDGEECRKLAELLKEMEARGAGACEGQPGPEGAAGRRALEGLDPEMVKKLAEGLACADGAPFELSDEDLERLAALLEGAQAELLELRGVCEGTLAEAGLDPGELAALLQGAAVLSAGLPGKGGVTRGPGIAPLQHVGKTEDSFGRFEAETFRGRGEEAEVDVGHLVVAPDESDVRPGEAVAGGAVRQFGPGNERLTWRTRLLPRHSHVLKEYFTSDHER